MNDTLAFIATRVCGLLVLLAIGYGAWRAIRSPLQPLATFLRAWATVLAVVRQERRLSLMILAAFALGQSLQVGFHFLPELSADILVIVSQAWQFCLTVFLAPFAARILLRLIPVVTFKRPDFEAAARFRQIALPVTLWAAAVWAVALGLTVLFNFVVMKSAPEWRWYVAVPAPMFAYLMQTPLILIRPALVFGQTASEGIAVAVRHLGALVLLNLLFTLPPFIVPILIFSVAIMTGSSHFAAYIAGQIVNVPFSLLQFLAYELAALISFGIATGLAPRIRFNRTFSAFYPC